MRAVNYKNYVNDNYKEYIIIDELDFYSRKSRIKLKHSCGYIYETSIESLILGSKCPKCSINERAKKRTKTTDKFKEEVFNIVGNEYEVIGEYSNSLKKIDIRHNICGNVFSMRPASFLHGSSIGKKSNGYRCPICEIDLKISRAKKRTKTTDKFKEEVFNIAGNEYEVIGEYALANEKIEFKHNECGNSFLMTPNKFLQNRRCPICSYKSLNEEFLSNYLTSIGVKFEREVTYDDLFDVCKLRYDFKIYYGENDFFLLEYNGLQHYKSIKYYGGDDAFRKRIDHDNMKENYAKKNNIDFYIIKYGSNIKKEIDKILDHYKSSKLTGNSLEL